MSRLAGDMLLDIIGEIDSGLIEKAENPSPKRNTAVYIKYCAIAACVTLVVVAAAAAFGKNHGGNPIETLPPVGSSGTSSSDTNAPEEDPPPVEDPGISSGNIAEPEVPAPQPPLNGLDYILSLPEGGTVYPECGFNGDNPVTGQPGSYEEYIEDTRYYDQHHSLVRLKILDRYTPEEAYELTGEEYFLSATTLFKAVITYNYLTDRPMKLEINLSHAGTTERQIEGYPLYMQGEEYIAYLSGGEDGSYAAYMEFAVHEVNGIELAYQVGEERLKLESDYVTTKFTNLDLEMDESERRVVTSTPNNPVVYSYKMTVNDLVGFIREDWLNRGFVFEGFDKPDIDNSYLWSRQFKYHDVEKVLLPEREFSAQPSDWIGGDTYNYTDVKDDLLSDKNGLQLIRYKILNECDLSEQSQYSLPNDGTLYNIQIIKDCIEDKAIESPARLWHYGNGRKQFEGYPVFKDGEEFIAAVYQDESGVLYPIYELEFLVAQSPIEDTVYAYHIGYIETVKITIDGYDLETGLGEIEAARRSSTENNQYWLHRKFIPERLEEYLRTHWVNSSEITCIRVDSLTEAEAMPAAFSRIEELIAAAGGAPITDEPDRTVLDNLNITDINYFYAPTAEFEGYKLFNVEVLPKRIFFYYLPSDITPKAYNDLKNAIIVSYARNDCLTEDCPVEKLAEQEGADLTEDGFLYEPDKNSITFSVGDSWMSIRVPDDMNNYEQLKGFCKAERIEVK